MNPEALTSQQRFQHLFTVISSDRFLKMQGLGNEVPFFICPYPPKEAVEMAQTVNQLIRRLEQQGIQVLKIDLYDLSIELLQRRGIWERILDIEETTPKANCWSRGRTCWTRSTILCRPLPPRCRSTPSR